MSSLYECTCSTGNLTPLTAELSFDISRDWRRVCLSVRLSVCLSVTRWYSVKTNKRRITRFTPTGSQRTLPTFIPTVPGEPPCMDFKRNCENKKLSCRRKTARWVAFVLLNISLSHSSHWKWHQSKARMVWLPDGEIV